MREREREKMHDDDDYIMALKRKLYVNKTHLQKSFKMWTTYNKDLLLDYGLACNGVSCILGRERLTNRTDPA